MIRKNAGWKRPGNVALCLFVWYSDSGGMGGMVMAGVASSVSSEAQSGSGVVTWTVIEVMRVDYTLSSSCRWLVCVEVVQLRSKVSMHSIP